MNTKPSFYLTKPVQVRLKPELHEWVHEIAKAQDRSANWVINKVIEEASTKHFMRPEGATA